MENIWESYDFKAIEKQVEEKQKQLSERFSWMIVMIKEEVQNIIGDFPELLIKPETTEEKKWFKSKISVGVANYSAFEINLDENDQLILFQPFSNMNGYNQPIKTLVFDPSVIFRVYVKQMIVNELQPQIKSLYKKNIIKEIPEKLKDTVKTINLSNVTEELFKKLFNKVTEKHFTVHEAKKIKVKNQDEKNLLIDFAIDCDRYGYYKHNTIEINDRGDIRVNLSDSPVQGSIESYLKKEIKKLIEK